MIKRLFLLYRNFNTAISFDKFRYNGRGFGGLQAIPQGVTGSNCDEKEQLRPPERRSPYGQDRQRAKQVPILIILVFSLLGCGSEKNPVSPVEIQNSYRVKKVIDGDTIVLDNDEVVRYIGIDTPEIRRKLKSKWVYDPKPYAEEAEEFNRQLVEGKVVNLEFDVEKRDRYGRLLAYVYVDNIFVNAKMLQEGYALLYTYPPNIKYVELFIRKALEARENKKGLWSERP